MLGESDVLLVDLVGQLSGVAQDQYLDLTLLLGAHVHQVKTSKHEDSGLAHTGAGLADDVSAVHGNGDALVLDLGGGLEAALGNSAEELGSKDEVLEVGGVHSTVIATSGSGERNEEI